VTRDCPTGCGRTARTGHLMCGPCWAEVPKHLQREVYRTWRNWRRNVADGDAMRAYREASDAAVAAVP
jgi:hypothetical protein